MAILIKGMEMPEHCGDCSMLLYGSCLLHDGVPAHQPNVHKRPYWCPLIEVPPHGDLIDRDALWEHVEDLSCNIWVTASGVPVEALEKAPTVIEASSDSDG